MDELTDFEITVTFVVPAYSPQEARDTIVNWLREHYRIPCLAYEVANEQDIRGGK